MSTGDSDIERRMEAVAEHLRERQATVHERQPCPRCGAPLGQRCRAMPGGYAGRRGGRAGVAWVHPLQPGRTVKHPHRERLRADGITDR